MAQEYTLSPFAPPPPRAKKRHPFPFWSVALSLLAAIALCGAGLHFALTDGASAEMAAFLAWPERHEAPLHSGDTPTDAAARTAGLTGMATHLGRDSAAGLHPDLEEAVSSDPMFLTPEEALRDSEPEDDPALLSMDAPADPASEDYTVFSPFAPDALAVAVPEWQRIMAPDDADLAPDPDPALDGQLPVLSGQMPPGPATLDALAGATPQLLLRPLARNSLLTAALFVSLVDQEKADSLQALAARRGLPGANPVPRPENEGEVKVPPGLDPAWTPLLAALEKDGFDRTRTEAIFTRLGANSYTPAFMAAKITELYGVTGLPVRRDSVPEPRLPDDYKLPVGEATVGSCVEFMNKHKTALDDIEKRHGVQRSTILGVLLVETRLGTNLGRDSALRALASMAMTSTPDMLGSRGNAAQRNKVRAATLPATLRDKSRWAYKELKALLNYAAAQSCEAHLIPGSVFGAIGICQFMPSNVEPFGADGDGDGSIDLFNVTDAMYSVARYLESNGWKKAAAQPQKHAVIRTYNHSYSYASTVLATANYLDRALAGKVPLTGSPVIGVAGNGPGRVHMRFSQGGRYLDPSLKLRRGSVRRSARLNPLGSYADLLQ